LAVHFLGFAIPIRPTNPPPNKETAAGNAPMRREGFMAGSS
jgi:hypothetical protein